MKKLIKILTVISVLGSTVLSSHLTKTLVSDVYFFINKGFKSKNLFPFINKVNGINEAENIKNIVVHKIVMFILEAKKIYLYQMMEKILKRYF